MKNDTKPSVSIVIPAYNEEANIEDVVLDSLRVLESVAAPYEVLVVNDASRDNTGGILDELVQRFPGTVRVLHHKKNMGANLSLIELYRNARWELIFFLPADKQIRPESLDVYLKMMEEQEADIILGWRAKREDPPHRVFFNWAYRMAMKIFLGISFRDATASDLYKKSVLDQIQMESRGRLLQAEIATKASYLGYKVQEIPVEHYPRVAGKQTGINPKTMWLSFMDLLRVGSKIKRIKKKPNSRS